MTKPIASLLFASVLCGAPVLASSYLEKATSSHEPAVSGDEEDFVDTGYDDEEFDETLAVSVMAEEFEGTEIVGSAQSSIEEDDFGIAAFVLNELESEGSTGAQNYGAFLDELGLTLVAGSYQDSIDTASDAVAFEEPVTVATEVQYFVGTAVVFASAQTGAAEGEEDVAEASGDPEEAEREERTLEVATSAPSNDQLAAVVLGSAQDPATTAAATNGSAEVAPETTDLAKVTQMIADLENMNGKTVIDQDGDPIGTITGVNEETTAAQIELASGRTIGVIPEMLTDMGNGSVAMLYSSEGSAVAASDLSGTDQGLTTIETQ